MKRSSNTFWPVLLGILAIGVIVVPTASGQANFTAENHPAVITGHLDLVASEEEEVTFGFTEKETVSCAEFTEEGTLKAKSPTLPMFVHFGACTSSSGLSTTVEPNGCIFEFEAGEATEEEKEAHGSMSIVCPEGESIDVKAATCTIHVAPQTELTGVIFTNKAAGGATPKSWITVDVDIKNQVTYEETDGFLCPFEGSNEETNGDLAFRLIWKAYEDKGTEPHASTPGTQYKEGAAYGLHVK